MDDSISVEVLKEKAKLPLRQVARELGIERKTLKRLYHQYGIEYVDYKLHPKNISKEWLEQNKHRPIDEQAKELGTCTGTLYSYYRKHGIMRPKVSMVESLGEQMIVAPHGGCENCIRMYGSQIYRLCKICQASLAPVLCEFKECMN